MNEHLQDQSQTADRLPAGKRGWFVGCGCGCGGNAYVRNAGLVLTTDCPNLAEFAKEGYDSPVSIELGWCLCGQPERVSDLMLDYLEALAWRRSDEAKALIALHDYSDPRFDTTNTDAHLLLAYLADRLEWTEHGGSVGGAWFTEDGLQALANLRAWSETQEPQS